MAILAVAFVVLAAVPAALTEDDAVGSGEVLYVNGTYGDNSNDGTEGNPLKTIAVALMGSNVKTIVLLGDLTEDVKITAGKTITLDLKGKTLTNSTADTIYVELGAKLTIKDSSTEKTGKVDDVSHGKAAVFNNGTVVLDGGNYTRSEENGESKENSGGNSYYNILNHGIMTINAGVSVTQSGQFSSLVASGYYEYTKSSDQRAGYVSGTNQENPSLTINGGTFSGGLNTIKNDDGGNLEINGGTFSNTAQAVILNANEATINSGKFEAQKQAVVSACYNNGYNKGITNINGGTFEVGKGYYPVEMKDNGKATLGEVNVKAGVISGSIVGLRSGLEKVTSYAGTVKIGNDSITFSGITVGSENIEISAQGLSGSLTANTEASISGTGVLNNVTMQSGTFKVSGVTIKGLNVSAGAVLALNGDSTIAQNGVVTFAPLSNSKFASLSVVSANSVLTLQDGAKIVMNFPNTTFTATGTVQMKFVNTFSDGDVSDTEVIGIGATLTLSGTHPFTVLENNTMILGTTLVGDVNLTTGATLQLSSGGQYSGTLAYGERGQPITAVSFSKTGSVDFEKLSGTGTISADKSSGIETLNGVLSVLSGGSISTTDSTTVSIPKDSKLSISGTLNAKVQNSGTIEVAEGGSMTLKEGSTVGTIRFLGGTISGDLSVSSNDKILLAGNAVVASGKTLTLNGSSNIKVETAGSAIVLQSGAKMDTGGDLPTITAKDGDLSIAFAQTGMIGDIEFSGEGKVGISDTDKLSIPAGVTVTLKTAFTGAVEMAKSGDSASSLVIDQGGVYTGTVTHGTDSITVSGIKAVDNGKVTIKAGSVEITGAMSATEASAAISAADGKVILKDLTITEGTLSLTAPVAVEGTLTVSSGSSIEAQSGASIAVSSGSTLAVDTGATVSLSSTASISAESGSEIKVSNNATLDVKEDATVAMTGGATLTADTGSTVAVSDKATISADTGSKIAVDSGASITLAGDSKVEVKSGASMSISKSSTVSSTGSGTVVVEQSAKVDVSGTLDAKTENSGQINASTGSTVSEDKVDNTSTGKVTKQTSFIVIPDTTTDSDPIVIVPDTTESTDNGTDVKTVACIAAALVVVVLAVFILADTRHR